jgi:hypothetical protein
VTLWPLGCGVTVFRGVRADPAEGAWANVSCAATKF